jgi:hypothetical protein
LTSRREPVESNRITVIMADLKREISILSILKVVIVLVVTTGQGTIEYIYIIVLYKKTGVFTYVIKSTKIKMRPFLFSVSKTPLQG